MRGQSSRFAAGSSSATAPRRQLIEMPPNIEDGTELLERQGTPYASGLRPRQHGPAAAPRFGGGTTPVKTGHPIHRHDVGRLAVWEADGYLAIARDAYVVDAPDDGQAYARQSGSWVVVGTGTGFLEAPNDGRDYVRRGFDQTWQPLPYIIPEAPGDGQGYVRIGLNSSWRPAFTQAQADARYASIATASFPEAPLDGRAYARRGWDRTWLPVATGAGVEEAPVDGYLYVRRGSDASWQLAFTKAQADGLYAPITQASPMPPLNPLPGDLWFDPTGTQLYIWYDDGTSGQWVVANNSAGTGGAGGIADAPLTGGPYGRQASSWVAIATNLILDAGVY